MSAVGNLIKKGSAEVKPDSKKINSNNMKQTFLFGSGNVNVSLFLKQN